MSYEEFMYRVLSECDDPCCPWDGIRCERPSCKDCPTMRKEYSERWGNE